MIIKFELKTLFLGVLLVFMFAYTYKVDRDLAKLDKEVTKFMKLQLDIDEMLLKSAEEFKNFPKVEF